MWRMGLRFHPTVAEVLFAGLLEDAEARESGGGERLMAGFLGALAKRRR